MALLVNGEYLDDSAINAEMESLRPRLQEAMAGEPEAEIEQRVVDWSRENLIERMLLEQAALKNAEPIAPEVLDAAVAQARAQQNGRTLPGSEQTLRREVELQLLRQNFFRSLTEGVPPPDDAEIAAFYQDNTRQFTFPETVHAAHIVKNVDGKTSEVEALAKLGEVEAKLRDGATFEELADQYSDCPGRGGDLGFFGPGQMVEEFDAAVFALAPGEVSRIVRSVFGFHLVKLYERRRGGIRPLKEVKAEIRQQLLDRARERVIENYADELLAAARIEEVAGRSS